MALEQQIKTLDRWLRRGGQRDHDAGAVMAAVDEARLKAFSKYLGQKITERWWLERFPATLRGIARVFGEDGDNGESGEDKSGALFTAARHVLPSPFFEKAIGEDRSGAALLGWLCAQEACPSWLRELAGYEYLLDTGLRLRADGEEIDGELEGRLLPEVFDAGPAETVPAGSLALGRRLVGVCFDHAVDDIAGALHSGLALEESELGLDPRALLFVIEEEGFLELEARYPDADILQLCAHPQSEAGLAALFEGLDIAPLLDNFIAMGFLTRGA